MLAGAGRRATGGPGRSPRAGAGRRGPRGPPARAGRRTAVRSGGGTAPAWASGPWLPTSTGRPEARSGTQSGRRFHSPSAGSGTSAPRRGERGDGVGVPVGIDQDGARVAAGQGERRPGGAAARGDRDAPRASSTTSAASPPSGEDARRRGTARRWNVVRTAPSASTPEPQHGEGEREAEVARSVGVVAHVPHRHQEQQAAGGAERRPHRGPRAAPDALRSGSELPRHQPRRGRARRASQGTGAGSRARCGRCRRRSPRDARRRAGPGSGRPATPARRT